jgi:hypothetical protein
METSASCEARYAPLLYPTNQVEFFIPIQAMPLRSPNAVTAEVGTGTDCTKIVQKQQFRSLLPPYPSNQTGGSILREKISYTRRFETILTNGV